MSADDLPIVCYPLSGYLRLNIVDSSVKYTNIDERFLFHRPKLPALNRGNRLNKLLQQHLAAIVDELQDVELNHDSIHHFQQQRHQRTQQLSWLGNVKVQQVEQTGPGSRAYNPSAERQLQVVVPTRDIQKHHVVGLYMVSNLPFDIESVHSTVCVIIPMCCVALTSEIAVHVAAQTRQQSWQQSKCLSLCGLWQLLFGSGHIGLSEISRHLCN